MAGWLMGSREMGEVGYTNPRQGHAPPEMEDSTPACRTAGKSHGSAYIPPSRAHSRGGRRWDSGRLDRGGVGFAVLIGFLF